MALTAFGRQIDIAKTQLLGPARTAFMVDTARAAFADAMATNTAALGRPPPWEQIVDGSRGGALEAVKPGGTIVFLFDVAGVTLRQAVNHLLRNLRRLSPIDESKYADDTVYRDSHVVLVNNVPRSYGPDDDIGELQPNDEIQITNLLPYARRIERSAWSKQAPNGVYEVAFNAHSQAYTRILFMKFTWAVYPGRGIGKARRGGPPNTAADVRRSMQYPTIVIKAK